MTSRHVLGRDGGTALSAQSKYWKIVLVVGACFIAEYYAFPVLTNQNIVYSFLGKAAVVCVLLGVRLNRPKDRGAWYLIAAAIGCFSIGDDITTYYQVVRHNLPFPSFADAIYLLGYPFLFAGVIRLTRTSTDASSRENTCDATIVALGALAISWQFLMDSYVHNLTLSTFGMFVNLAYPMMDIGLIFVVFRALLLREARYAFQRMLATSMVVLFVGDFIFDLLQLHTNYNTGSFVDAFYLTQYVLFGATALHPSLTLTSSDLASEESTLPRIRPSTSNRLPIVILAGFIPPMILFVASIARVHVNVLALSTICIAVFLVITLRLVWLISRISSQSRELTESFQELGALEERFRFAFEDNMAPMLFTDSTTA